MTERIPRDVPRHGEMFGRYLDKLGPRRLAPPPFEELVRGLLESGRNGDTIIAMQIFLEDLAAGLLRCFQQEGPDRSMQDVITRTPRGEPRHAAFGAADVAELLQRIGLEPL